MNVIPYGRQDISAEDVEAVIGVLRSDFLTQGPAIDRFEAAVAAYCGAKYAVAVCNATAALHIACLASGLQAGDRLWTSPNTFVASANCGLYCGAEVDFVDIDPETFNLDPATLEAKLEAAAKAGTLPKILAPVHFSGQPCDMERIAKAARRHGVTLLEDASHAVGAKYRGRPVGDCAFSDMAVFSFHPVKIVTTAEGGMVLTNRKDLYERLIRLRSHGITRDPAYMQGESDGPWYYQQVDLGYNYRITDMQAALGASQMARLDAFVARRTALAERYDRLLAKSPLDLPGRMPGAESSHHLYVIRLKPELAAHRRRVFESLRADGIGVNLHYIPVHTQPYYRGLGFRAGDFPVSEDYYRRAMSIPLYPGMSDTDQDRVVAALEKALQV
jgi:UDP-4-amino-4,6-dideoxy-N-acetyl-beta-L-altrosamine transaminase